MGRLLKGTPLTYCNPKQVVWVRTSAGDFACTAETEINSSAVTVVVQDNGSAHAFCESSPKESYRQILRKQRGYPRPIEDVLKSGVAVLYSVVAGAVREFWVKTKGADRLIATDSSRTIPISAILSVREIDGVESTSGSASITVTFEPTGTTIVEPETVSISLAASASEAGVFYDYAYRSVAVTGNDPVDVLVESSVTSLGELQANIGFALPGLTSSGWGIRQEVFNIGGGSSVVSDSISAQINKYLQASQGFLNGLNAFVRKTASFEGSPLLTSGEDAITLVVDGSANIVIAGADSLIFKEVTELSITVSVGGSDPRYVDQIRRSSHLVIINQSTPHFVYSFRLNEILSIVTEDGVADADITVSVVPQFTSDSSGATPVLGLTFKFVGTLIEGDIAYGQFLSGSGLLPVYSPAGEPIPVSADDWRAPLVDFVPNLSGLSPCLADFILNPQAILADQFYIIDLAQDVSGQTLRSRLQATTGSVGATLTSRLAINEDDACTLGTEAATQVNVPSPGRGTIEGITYIP